MRDSDLPRLLTPKQFAEEVQMHRGTLYRKLKAGDVPGAKKIGGRWKIPRWAIGEMGVPAHLATT
jgi:excisionase family DNA binding protein